MVSPKRFRGYFKNFELLAKTKFGWIDSRLYGHEVWVFKRHSVAGGLGLGVALAFIPLPIQMLLCLPFALFLKVNLPVALASVWLTNPVTAGPIFFFAFRIGLWLTGDSTTWASDPFEFSVGGLTSVMEDIWAPLVAGCLLCGIVSGFITYLLVNFTWRLRIAYLKRERQARASKLRGKS